MQEMARESYADDFRRRAVELYESTPGATLKDIARDLGVSPGALKEWADKLGTAPPAGRPESQAARITRLEAELVASKDETRKLSEERDFLRQAAKYFGGETSS